jgi:hypothetical protein
MERHALVARSGALLATASALLFAGCGPHAADRSPEAERTLEPAPDAACAPPPGDSAWADAVEDASPTFDADGKGLRLTGRLLDASGRPLARHRVRADATVGGGCTFEIVESVAATDGEGRFTTDFARMDRGSVKNVSLFVLADPDVLIGGASMALPADGSQVVDLGDRRMIEAEDWCEGVVVDDVDRPVAGAELLLLSTRSIESVTTVSDGQGRFKLRGVGRCEAGTLLITTSWVGEQIMDGLPFTPGDRAARFVVRRRGGISGRLVFERYVPTGDLRVEARLGNSTTSVHVGEDGMFCVRGLDPGLHRVAVKLPEGGPSTELVVVEDVRVVGEEIGRDPRLAEIDLRPWIQPLELHVSDLAGSPVNGDVFEAVNDGGRARKLGEVHDGMAILAVTRPTDLEIRSAGRRTAFVPAASGRADVVVEDALPVRVRFLPVLPPIGSWSVRVLLEPSSDCDAWTDGSRCDGGDGALLHLPRPGSYLLELRIGLEPQDHVDSGSSSTPALSIQLPRAVRRIQIADQKLEQVFEIALASDVVERMVDTVEESRAKWRERK